MFPERDSRKQPSSKDTSSDGGREAITVEQVERLCVECEKLGRLGQTGLALGRLTKAISAADDRGLSEPEWVARSVALRETAAKIARGSGSFAEALELIDEAISLQKKIAGPHDRSVFVIRGDRAELLLEMGQSQEARRAYEVVREWSQSAYGHPVEGVRSQLGIAAVHARVGDSLECTESLEAAAELFDEVVTSESMKELARALLQGAKLFSADQHFELGAELASLSTGYLQMSGAFEGEKELSDTMRFEASLAMKAGLFDRGVATQQDLLAVLNRRLGEVSSESFALRGAMARDAFERGDLEAAELLLLKSLNLSTQRPVALDMTARGRDLQHFYLRVGRQMSAACASLAIQRGLNITNDMANCVQALRSEPEGAGSAAPSRDGARSEQIGRVAKEVRARLRQAMTLLKGGDRGPAFNGQLNAAEERAIELPKRLYESALRVIERIKGMGSSSEAEFEVAIDTSERRIREFEKVFGKSREVTRAARYCAHAKLLFAAGQCESAAEWMERGAEILKARGLQKSFMYARLLRDYASVLPSSDYEGQRMSAEAARIVALIRASDRGGKDDPEASDS